MTIHSRLSDVAVAASGLPSATAFPANAGPATRIEVVSAPRVRAASLRTEFRTVPPFPDTPGVMAAFVRALTFRTMRE